MAASKKRTTTQKEIAAVPIPGTLSIQGPLPVTGMVTSTIGRQTWEYLIKEVPANYPIAEFRAYLAARGAEGWELIGGFFISPTPIIFKRPVA